MTTPMNRVVAALVLALPALAVAADVVIPPQQEARSVTATAAWILPVAVVFLVIFIARRKQRDRN
jgi:hypothetical protein